jgi:hypothetical protein
MKVGEHVHASKLIFCPGWRDETGKRRDFANDDPISRSLAVQVMKLDRSFFIYRVKVSEMDETLRGSPGDHSKKYIEAGRVQPSWNIDNQRYGRVSLLEIGVCLEEIF